MLAPVTSSVPLKDVVGAVIASVASVALEIFSPFPKVISSPETVKSPVTVASTLVVTPQPSDIVIASSPSVNCIKGVFSEVDAT